MELTLARRVYTAESTTGEIIRVRDSSLACYSIEDHYPIPYVKTPGRTCIPEGIYLIDMHTVSPKYGRIMPRIYNVVTPGGDKVIRSADGKVEFRGVLIHTGNKADDSEGCVVVGRKLGVNRVDESRLAFNALEAELTEAARSLEPMYLHVKRA